MPVLMSPPQIALNGARGSGGSSLYSSESAGVALFVYLYDRRLGGHSAKAFSFAFDCIALSRGVCHFQPTSPSGDNT